MWNLPPLYGSDNNIPALKWEDTNGDRQAQLRHRRPSDVRSGGQETIDRSKLTDWQKVDAINTFALSKLKLPPQLLLPEQVLGCKAGCVHSAQAEEGCEALCQDHLIFFHEGLTFLHTLAPKSEYTKGYVRSM